jgi:hypothetical protein
MKLRLQFNSVRLRLKRSEVEQFARTGRVEEKIVFGGGAKNTLHYVLEASASVASPRSSLTANGVLVQVPPDVAERWASGNEVSIEGTQAVGKQAHLRVLIEKDFACLDGTEEQNVDTFPHPLSGTNG